MAIDSRTPLGIDLRRDVGDDRRGLVEIRTAGRAKRSFGGPVQHIIAEVADTDPRQGGPLSVGCRWPGQRIVVGYGIHQDVLGREVAIGVRRLPEPDRVARVVQGIGIGPDDLDVVGNAVQFSGEVGRIMCRVSSR